MSPFYNKVIYLTKYIIVLLTDNVKRFVLKALSYDRGERAEKNAPKEAELELVI